MKNVILLMVALLSALFLTAQVTTVPLHPTADDEVTLTLNTAGTGLEDYSGEVYAHTGYNDWAGVIGSWGDNDTQPHLVSLGGGLYELTLTPDIRAYYGIDATTEVTQLCFVFRAAEGSPQTSDLIISIYNGLTAEFTSPSDETLFLESGSTINVEAAGPFSDLMKLYVNGTEVTQTTEETLTYDIDVEAGLAAWEMQEVVVTASSATATVSDTFWYARRPAPENIAVPDGIVNGINYIDDNTVILSLYAPFHEYAFVIGGFNDWQTATEYYMNFDESSDRYWLQVNDLEAGKEYIFQYLVDGSIRIGDPYADKVSDPWNDKYISEETYPGLLEFPEDKTEWPATVLQTAQTPYEWEVDAFELPPVEDMVIYELLVRDFIEEHDFKTLIDTMSYFTRLGVNVIELMPVSEFEGNLSWGYNPDYYFAPDKYYGPKNDFKAFIDECHKNGIAVVMDMVLNHSYGLAPYVRLWWDDELNQPTEDNPYYNSVCPSDPYCWGYDFDHSTPQTQAFVNRVNSYWMEEYKVDGYRFDYTKGFTQTAGNPSFDQWRIDYLEQMADYIWAQKSDAIIILEHWCDNSEEKILADYGMMLWGNSTYNYSEAAMGWIPDSDFDWISYTNRGWEKPNLVGYMESHDEERLMYKVETYGNDNTSAYPITDLDVGLTRAELAAVFMLPVPGPKMIWQFGERGYDVSINQCPDGSISEDCRVDAKPPYWEYMEDVRRQKIFNVYRMLIDLKTEQEPFSTPNFDMAVSGAYKRITLYGENGEDVVIIGNFGTESALEQAGFTRTGTWYEFFSEESIEVNDQSVAVTLEPGEYRLYSTEQYVRPAYGIFDADGRENSMAVRAFPNPANSSVTIAFDLESRSNASIQIFDLQGRVVEIVADQQFQFGTNQVTVDLSNYASGVYLYRVVGNRSTYSSRLIVE